MDRNLSALRVMRLVLNVLEFDAFALVEDNGCVESDSLTLGYSNEIISSGYGAVIWKVTCGFVRGYGVTERRRGEPPTFLFTFSESR